jgi:protease PrsW
MAFLVAVPLAFIPAFLFSWFIYWLDRYEKEPRWLLIMAFVWGGFVAVIGAIIGSIILDVGFTAVLQDETLAEVASGSITAPFVEEFWKGLAVLAVVLIFRKELIRSWMGSSTVRSPGWGLQPRRMCCIS